jgi:hypothetical protein
VPPVLAAGQPEAESKSAPRGAWVNAASLWVPSRSCVSHRRLWSWVGTRILYIATLALAMRVCALAGLRRNSSVNVLWVPVETKTSSMVVREPTVVVPVHPGPLLSFGVGMNDQVASTAASPDASCVVVLVAFPHATVVRVHHIFTTSIADASHHPILWRLCLPILLVRWRMLRGCLRLRMRGRMLCSRIRLRMCRRMLCGRLRLRMCRCVLRRRRRVLVHRRMVRDIHRCRWWVVRQICGMHVLHVR